MRGLLTRVGMMTLVLWLPLSSAVIAQGGAASLVVTGDVSAPLSLSLSDVKAMPRTKVVVQANAAVNTFEGVSLSEILKRAGAQMGGPMGRNSVASYVVARASDGYQALFAFAEVDPMFSTNEILVADTVDGRPLPEAQGAWRLIVPGDKQGSRAVRMLQRLEIVRLNK